MTRITVGFFGWSGVAEEKITGGKEVERGNSGFKGVNYNAGPWNLS